MSKSGFIVYNFAHYGIGRVIKETDNMFEEKKNTKRTTWK